MDYVSVTWTAGDTITEAKLDNMVANDQAENAHPSLRLSEISEPSAPAADKANLYAYDSGGTTLIRKQTADGRKEIIGVNKIFTLTDGATVAIDFDNSKMQQVTLGGNRTFTFANPLNGATYILLVKQDGTGSRTVTWPTIRWSGGSPPTLTTTASKADMIGIVWDGTDYFGVVVGLNF